ncbi:Kunitz/Bovine pancreatic trypsin inhibitor domain protein [Ancylostoma caninum]|uniref:Kunitz/Bovine pancreatic trypsin inhibitor domain protein n=1 Tax=Ancylostoma caninum TaxID=29170 RepID=A0A368H1G6_ANCCA|nr:Kunitz/Bovine pancreatic trypsin inhibitor domain protein [Ancylostoma caninum]
MEADGRIPTYGQRMEADGRIPTYGQPGVTASRTNPNAETVTLPADVEYKPLYLYDPEIVDRYGGNRIPTYGETGVTAVFTNPDRETVTLPADVEDQPLYLYDPEIVDRCSPSTLTSGPVCDTYSIRYKYNAETKECEKFTQRDCVPSPNSFETHQECEATCMVADLSDNSSPSS